MDGQPLSALRDLFGERLFTSREQRICYSYDATGTMSLPDAVAFPVSAEEGRPGVVTETLKEEARKRGLFYPPDPASLKFCTIGGNIAECSGGMCAVKYGVTRDYVMGLEAVLGTGGLIRARIPPCAMELMDRTAIDCVREEADLPVPDDAGCALLIEVDGPRESVSAEADRGEQACRQYGAIEVGRAGDAKGRERLWTLRRSISPALRKVNPVKINEDIAVPRRRLPEMMAFLADVASRRNLKIVNFGHAGDGNVHVNEMISGTDEEEGRRGGTGVAAMNREQLAPLTLACAKCGTCRTVCTLYPERKAEISVARGKVALVDAALSGLCGDAGALDGGRA